ncbi:MAG: deoxyguanosinetriphosphate triphosphohydrolase, partial [Rickettsiales bacterium]|nr:deoxyguanosinetriphosphate triphosphohydrolase [Rickettsiales bacterium]
FSDEMQAVNKEVKQFLMNRMYRHYKVNRMTSKAKRVVAELFEFFMEEPICLPHHWQEALKNKDEQTQAVLVADFIAGMTDRFALEEHARIFDPMART